jgi:hypothetical protein
MSATFIARSWADTLTKTNIKNRVNVNDFIFIMVLNTKLKVIKKYE